MPRLRGETPVRFKTTVTRQMIRALRGVYADAGRYDVDFPNGVNVVNAYPLTQVQYPAIVVNFRPTKLNPAGLGHTEEFPDIDGNTRTWQHMYYEGEIEFTVVALDPEERDILADSLIEILSFSHLTDDPVLNAFFVQLNNNPDDTTIGTIFQLNLNTDLVMPGGTNATTAPWEAEDVLLYEETYSVNCMGGFYNAIITAFPGYLEGYAIEEPVELEFTGLGTYVDPDQEIDATDSAHGNEVSTSPFRKFSATTEHNNSQEFATQKSKYPQTDTTHGADISTQKAVNPRTDAATGTAVATQKFKYPQVDSALSVGVATEKAKYPQTDTAHGTEISTLVQH